MAIKNEIFDKLDTIKIANSIMGVSVINGAIEILIPSALPYLIVSAMTRVNKGPGVKPPLRPKMIPEIKNDISVNIESAILFDL